VVKFIDITSLIKGAHTGEGLGNQFLSQIRQTDAILHLVRGFSNKNVSHVSNQVDPVHDISTINLELALADFELIQKLLEREKNLESDKREVLKKLLEQLKKGKLASEIKLDQTELELIAEYNLLTLKPMLYALNLDETAVGDFKQKKDMPRVLLLSAKLEAEINELKKSERLLYLKQLGLKESLLDRLIKECFKLLDLITFYTVVGGKQAQAWPLKKGKTVIEAAEMIHTDFFKNFIKAEVIESKLLIELGDLGIARQKGKLRLVSRDYVVGDGEVVEIKT